MVTTRFRRQVAIIYVSKQRSQIRPLQQLSNLEEDQRSEKDQEKPQSRIADSEEPGIVFI